MPVSGAVFGPELKCVAATSTITHEGLTLGVEDVIIALIGAENLPGAGTVERLALKGDAAAGEGYGHQNAVLIIHIDIDDARIEQQFDSVLIFNANDIGTEDINALSQCGDPATLAIADIDVLIADPGGADHNLFIAAIDHDGRAANE